MYKIRSQIIAIILAILVSFLMASAANAAKTVYLRTALTGGAAAALDGIDGAGLLDGDVAIVMASSVSYIYLLDADSAASESSPTVISPDSNAGDKRWVLQPAYGANAGDFKADGTVAMTGDLTITSATPDIVLNDSDNAAGTASINANSSGGANDMKLTIGVEDSTSASTPYIEVDGVSETIDFLKPITIADASNDNYIKVTNNTSRAATASVNEIYPEGNIWKVNQNGTESSLPIGPTAGQITFSGPTQARTVTLPDAAVTIPANPIGGTLGATTNVIPKASGTGTATLQASGITEDGTSASFGALNLVTTGSIQAGIKISSDANGMSSSEMTAVGLYGTMFFATGAGTWALPPAAAGMSFCVYSTTAAAIVINPDDSDDITLNGTLLADGDSITSASGAGDFICMVAIDAVHWYTLGRSGTWTDTN